MSDIDPGGDVVKVDVEFSLALNNRTGKYFALRDMINNQRQSIRSVRYWRFSWRGQPPRLLARFLGRLMTMEVRARCTSAPITWLLPRMRPSIPILFTDPLQTVLYNISASDTVIVHDMGPIVASEYYAPGVHKIYTKCFEQIAQAGPHVVFVSKASCDAFTELYGRSFSSLSVIYNPIRRETLAGEERAPAGVSGPFLLCVGAVGARKNQVGALRGFRAAALYDRGFQIVLCGGPEPGYQQVVEEVSITPGARLVGYASEAELRWLYRHAKAFILISWLEGFGLPVAEAIQRDLIPVLSEDPALREVAGECAIYVGADDDISIARGMLVATDMNENERRRRLEKGKDNLKEFDTDRVNMSWSRFFFDYEKRHRSGLNSNSVG